MMKSGIYSEIKQTYSVVLPSKEAAHFTGGKRCLSQLAHPSSQKLHSSQIPLNSLPSPSPANPSGLHTSHNKTDHLLNLLLISAKEFPVISANISAL